MPNIDTLLQEYALAEYGPVRLIRESSDNTVYCIGTDDKKILRIGKRLATRDVAFEYEGMVHLARSGVPVARWVKTKTGATHVVSGGQTAVLFDFLDGHHIEVDKDHLPTNVQCREAGRMLGLVSDAGRTFSPTTPRTRNIRAELERAVRLETVFTDEFEGGAEFIAEVKKALVFGKAQHETTGLIHNDYRPGNVFFGGDTVTGVIDFDWSCMGPIIKDLALAIVEWSFPDGADGANLELFGAFLDGYNITAGENVRQDERLYAWICFSTLSDAATYFCDLAEDPSSTKRIIKSYMYRKYLFFSKF